MKKILREPLVHFLGLGAILFLAASWIGETEESPRDHQIVVPAGKVEHLIAVFTSTWRRPPSPAELKDLLDEHVREEVAYREGLTLGLDQDDAVIRRRIRQKLDFVADDLAIQIEPTTSDLEAYLKAHPESFQAEARISFSHVYFNPESRSDTLQADVATVRDALQAEPSPDWREQGDRLLIDQAFSSVPEREVAALFGPEFVAALRDLPTNQWAGPIESGYGVHLVRIKERIAGRVPDLSEIEPLVRRDWRNERRAELKDDFYNRLLENYEVVIEWPDAAEASAP